MAVSQLTEVKIRSRSTGKLRNSSMVTKAEGSRGHSPSEAPKRKFDPTLFVCFSEVMDEVRHENRQREATVRGLELKLASFGEIVAPLSPKQLENQSTVNIEKQKLTRQFTMEPELPAEPKPVLHSKHGLDIWDNLGLKEIETKVYEMKMKEIAQDIVKNYLTQIIFKRRIQKLNKQKKVTDKQSQDLNRLYMLSRKKNTVLKEKQMRAKEELTKIANGLEDVIENKEQYKGILEIESANDKAILEEEIEDVEELNNELKASVVMLNKVNLESKKLYQESFGKSKQLKLEDNMRKVVFLRILKLFRPQEFDNAVKIFGLPDPFTTDGFDNQNPQSNKEIALSKKDKQAEPNQAILDYFNHIPDEKIDEVADIFIDEYQEQVYIQKKLQKSVLTTANAKHWREFKMDEWRKELLQAKQIEGAHLDIYNKSCIRTYLPLYLNDLMEKVDELESENNAMIIHVDEQITAVIKLYSVMVLLYVRLLVLKRNIVPEAAKVKGDLNNYLSAEDFLDHVRNSTIKTLLSYTVFGNIEKFFGPNVKLNLNLNEQVVGVCILKGLMSDSANLAIEGIYFDSINSGESKRMKDRKYDNWMRKIFQGEDPYNLTTSIDLLDWTIKHDTIFEISVRTFTQMRAHLHSLVEPRSKNLQISQQFGVGPKSVSSFEYLAYITKEAHEILSAEIQDLLCRLSLFVIGAEEFRNRSQTEPVDIKDMDPSTFVEAVLSGKLPPPGSIQQNTKKQSSYMKEMERLARQRQKIQKVAEAKKEIERSLLQKDSQFEMSQNLSSPMGSRITNQSDIFNSDQMIEEEKIRREKEEEEKRMQINPLEGLLLYDKCKKEVYNQFLQEQDAKNEVKTTFVEFKEYSSKFETDEGQIDDICNPKDISKVILKITQFEQKEERAEHFEPNFDKLAFFLKHKKRAMKKFTPADDSSNIQPGSPKRLFPAKDVTPEVTDYFNKKRTKWAQNHGQATLYDSQLMDSGVDRNKSSDKWKLKNSSQVLAPVPTGLLDSIKRTNTKIGFKEHDNISRNRQRSQPMKDQTLEPQQNRFKNPPRLRKLSTDMSSKSHHGSLKPGRRSREPSQLSNQLQALAPPSIDPIPLKELKGQETNLRRKQFFGIYLPSVKNSGHKI